MKDRIIHLLLDGKAHLTHGVCKLSPIQANDALDYLRDNLIEYLYLKQPNDTTVALFSQHIPWMHGDSFNLPEEAVRFLNKHWPTVETGNVVVSERFQ
jgi:hypothetical protein